ncbi:ectonucleoside triphosphate diphosphohydrolase 1 [Pyrenophora tritici-repentis Pt-1C-BFP]|uniref:Ectonucleoside triphosphate diphosphohydrolase 1 n=1 Tax=Pyrenophora tritici-repentis (strain Pt-1C-BFP) TaxID=426418 RepID=B2WGJ9_PYRTR|nr:ectonucleoside triphosphate diphosphohydrolase 1 [Pyrenophora tritici-repentis Pt-1C-BFP]EDU42106.1 ectonucleoside triphosphate diphosphohydrolase 1 [Pyrenophora tritici-repentis Pt-1C-BFP]
MGKWRYGVVLDAGSSGTRVHIYRWLNNNTARQKASDAQLHSLPVIETYKEWTKKIHPGISTFGEHPHDVGSEHLDKLLSHALKYVPLEEVPNTPLFLLATAGMRILPERQRKDVLKEVCAFARSLKAEVTKEGKIIDSDDDDDDEPKPKAAAKLVGTGKFKECLHQTYPLLEKEKKCTDSPCLINGQHVPAIDFDVNHFVGVSEFWHTTHEIFEHGHKDKAYDFKTYQERVKEFCDQDWKSVKKGIKKNKWGHKVDEEKAREVCFKASWVINMLHDGIGVPRVGIEKMPGNKNTTKAVINNAKAKGFLDPFQAVNKINDVEVSWTLGKMVLYASSEIPPPTEQALAVGFGSNAPGIPSDFQYPGGTPTPYESDSDWHRLFVEHPQGIPSFFLLIFIFIFIICLILGKEKRKAAAQTFAKFFKPKHGKDPLHRRRGRSFPAKLFGLRNSSPSTNYERVDLEDGDAANEFELDETYIDSSDNDLSDSSDGSKVGVTSGWATPQIKNEVAGATPMYFSAGTAGDAVREGTGLGLGPPGAFELGRTYSRERIKSRASSPKRSKMGVLDE